MLEYEIFPAFADTKNTQVLQWKHRHRKWKVDENLDN